MKKFKNINYYSSEEKEAQVKKIYNKLIRANNSIANLQEKINKLASKDKISKFNMNRLVSLTGKKGRKEQKVRKYTKQLDLLEKGQLVKLNAIEKFKEFFSEIEYKRQVKIWGLIFITPWALGMLFFFVPSVLTTLYWSFSKVNVTPGGVFTSFQGFGNFTYLFTSYVIDNTRIFTTEILLFVQNLAIDLPIIIIFSIIIAVLLNKEFKGHVIVKAIFFIPVIYNMALITSTLTGSFGQHMDDSISGNIGFVDQTINFFLQIGIGESLVNLVISSVDRIFTIVNLSGIQILIFIAAIQAIPKHLYEAAEVEGATKYESFWKITVPMITPMILTAAIYTVVDSFARTPIFRFLDYAMRDGNYGLAASISISYFVINVLIVGFIYLLFRGRVFYYDEK